jgi:hypothetical protein
VGAGSFGWTQSKRGVSQGVWETYLGNGGEDALLCADCGSLEVGCGRADGEDLEVVFEILLVELIYALLDRTLLCL